MGAPEQDTLPQAGRFTKKPVTIDAFQWNDQPRESWPGWAQTAPAILRKTKDELVASGDVPKSAEEWINFPDVLLQIATPHGWAICNPGDWVVMANPQDIYPVKPDMFAAIYQPARDANAPTIGQLEFENGLLMQFMVDLHERVNSEVAKKMPNGWLRNWINEQFANVHARITMLQGIREQRVKGGS